MKHPFSSLCLLTLLAITAPFATADPGWPRVFQQGGRQLTVYQPQVDYWHGYTNLHFRCAIAVKGVLKEEKFGVAEVEALTITDHGARVVAIAPLQREFRFGGVSDAELAQLRQAVDQLNPPGRTLTLALDRVIACLDPAQQPVQHAVQLNFDPPTIYGSTTPAILVMFIGEPRFVPVETNRADLTFALNTNWDLLYDTAARAYYLLNGEGWLTTRDVRNGPWVAAASVPASFSALPQDDNWAEARQRLPGKPAKAVPKVFVTTTPAELIVTQGEPTYAPIPGTRLQRVTNTSSVLLLHTGDGKLYFLVAGRWFRGGSLNGPWSAASADLPADFARIPDADPAAFVKASVPGTREAKDAALLASVPTTATVNVTNTINLNVTYSGPPQFVTITNTTVQSAVNTSKQVFLVSGKYYCCDQGVWLESTAATGPWTLCTSVPAAIYTIPPSNPNHNVTYVVVQSATPSTVTYTQTSGYSGEYVASTGALMFGVGMLVGAAIANNNDCDYCYYPPPPCHYSYGCGAVYHYGYGGYYGGGGAVYGPYGGAGYAAGYNPATGTYARSSYAYGPYGAASRTAAYNPYTGTSGFSRSASTAYGSARQSAAYNPYTGARAAGGSVNTAYGSAGRAAAYNPTTGQGAAGRYASGDYGSAGAVRTTGGSGLVAWDTEQGEGVVRKTQSGDIYASNGDTVYKKDADGSWSQNSGDGWESTDSPQQKAQSQATTRQQPAQAPTASAQSQARTAQPSAASSAANRQAPAQTRSAGGAPQTATAGSGSWSQQQSSLQAQSQARQYGNQQTQRTSQYRSSSPGYSGGRSAAGGRSGGRRR